MCSCSSTCGAPRAAPPLTQVRRGEPGFVLCACRDCKDGSIEDTCCLLQLRCVCSAEVCSVLTSVGASLAVFLACLLLGRPSLCIHGMSGGRWSACLYPAVPPP